ncbi:MAG: hypothetical protein HUJ94_03450 [Bacteroidales bacterium]|nr:hypothetical protein [Bacteroidales bacterium]
MKNNAFPTARIAGAFAVFATMLVACSPLSYTLQLEMNEPSASGLVLNGKSMAVAFVQEPDDTCFAASLADGFAYKLETEYFDGEESVPVFMMEKKEGADYSAKDTLVALIMDTEADVVFLIEPELPATDAGQMALPGIEKFMMNLHVYDSMEPSDQVLNYSGRTAFKPDALHAFQCGVRSAVSFLPVWEQQSFSFYYYDEAASLAVADSLVTTYDWKAAVSGWMGLLKTRNLQKRACYEYDIALGCFMLGQNKLAGEWLDRADADYALALSPGLRKRIDARLGR